MFDRRDTGHTQIPVSPNKPQSAEGAGDIFSYFLGIHESVSASRLPISRHGCVQQLAAIACSCKLQLCLSRARPGQQSFNSGDEEEETEAEKL